MRPALRGTIPRAGATHSLAHMLPPLLFPGLVVAPSPLAPSLLSVVHSLRPPTRPLLPATTLYFLFLLLHPTPLFISYLYLPTRHLNRYTISAIQHCRYNLIIATFFALSPKLSSFPISHSYSLPCIPVPPPPEKQNHTFVYIYSLAPPLSLYPKTSSSQAP